MGFSMEEQSSSCSLLYKAALAFTLIRWTLSWVFKLRSRRRSPQQSPPCSDPRVSPQMIRQSLILTTYGDITWRRRHHQQQDGPDTCAVCLSQLSESDEVRELRNCSHVFHRECIDMWVDHDGRNDDHEIDARDCYDDDDGDKASSNHMSCPLCRAPLLTTSQGLSHWSEPEPSWAIDTILYLFGDDLDDHGFSDRDLSLETDL
ncbi:hypothetical protein SAY86_002417 [Trapa natans]|uniref:RING-type domain-containing protein n=1 Tax=Trapa natans TaxID=22666 RepID=A0AAN7LD83_TRANT|nr:hypothetical protein SAY86_002417 [Trapa natans]